MFKKRLSLLITGLVFISLLQIACSLANIASTVANELAVAEKKGEAEGVPADGDAPVGQDPAEEGAMALDLPPGPPTPTPFIYNGTMPKSGTGGVFGRMLWNGGPVEGLEVKLCDKIKFFGGCEGVEYPTRTVANGVYAILDVPPGSYGLTYKALESDTWYYVTSGFLNAKDFEVPADQMVDVGDFNTIRTDLKIISPKEDERLSGVSRPVLSWEPYEGAAYYELTFHSGRGGSLIHRKEMTETSFTMDRDLQTCDYTFDVEAFNGSGVAIAEYDGWSNFQIAGLPQSCNMVALSPADGATASATGIKLTWQPHEWAAVYKIHLYLESDSNVKILDFVESTEPSYTITQNVPAGTYYWVVYGYDEFDDGVGFTDGFILNVTNP